MALLAYYNNTDGTREEAELRKLPDFLVHFRRCGDYDGGFGFDWMRDEYIYETKDLVPDHMTDGYKEVSKPSLCQNKNELKQQYQIQFKDRETPYFIPWISMFPNHEQKIGTKVKLQVKVEILDTKWKKGKIIFECPSGIQVIPSKVELTRKDTVIQTTMGRKANEYTSTEIEIICSQAHAGDIITVKNVPSKKGNEEHSVGWLNLFANNKEYPLNIRLVKFLRREHLEADKAFFNQHLEKIKVYLKTKSLQQVMIVPEIEVVDEIIISEQQWKDEKILKEINDPDDYSQNPKKILAIADDTDDAFVKKYRETFEYKEEETDCEEYEEYLEFKQARNEDKYKNYTYVFENGEANRGKKTIKKRTLFTGVVVMLANMYLESPGIGGMGIFHPTQDGECLISRTGIIKDLVKGNYYSTIPHEIGHILGLHHTFEDLFIKYGWTDEENEERKNRLNSYIQTLSESSQKIIEYNKEVDKYKTEKEKYIKKNDTKNAYTCEKNIQTYKKGMLDLSENILKCNEYISNNKKMIESYNHFKNKLNINHYFAFLEGQTDNIMDYVKLFGNSNLFSSFFYWQWIIMQKDIIYHQPKKI